MISPKDTAPNNLPALALEILLGLGFRYARIALAPLNHIALASEPANILDAGSLYRLGQRRRQATVRCNILWAIVYPPAVLAGEYSRTIVMRIVSYLLSINEWSAYDY